jgi:hypothetical protein
MSSKIAYENRYCKSCKELTIVTHSGCCNFCGSTSVRQDKTERQSAINSVTRASLIQLALQHEGIDYE